MDIALMASGAGIAFWGSRMKDPTGDRSGAGNLALMLGFIVLLVGSVIFSIAFVHGFSQGLQQSR